MFRSRFLISFSFLLLIASVFSEFVSAQETKAISLAARSEARKAVIQKTQEIIFDVRSRSFPEFSEKDIKVNLFKSESIFFKARFSFKRFLTFRDIHTTIFVNPRVFELNPPEAGIRAIIAHELAHALYYKQRNRLALFGLVRLVNDDSNARFERRADLTAIARGFGEGLIEYRKWLYQSVPAKNVEAKRRDYFSPEEITVMLEALRRDPAILTRLTKKVPRNLQELHRVTASADVP